MTPKKTSVKENKSIDDTFFLLLETMRESYREETSRVSVDEYLTELVNVLTVNYHPKESICSAGCIIYVSDICSRAASDDNILPAYQPTYLEIAQELHDSYNSVSFGMYKITKPLILEAKMREVMQDCGITRTCLYDKLENFVS